MLSLCFKNQMKSLTFILAFIHFMLVAAAKEKKCTRSNFILFNNESLQ